MTVNINVEYLSTDNFDHGVYSYYGGYGKNVFSDCSSLREKSKHRIRKTGYKGEF